jgi:hypothetical protein
LPEPELTTRFQGWSTANARRLARFIRNYLPGNYAPPEFHRHRYPGISLRELNERISRIQQLLGDHREIHTDQLFDQTYLMSS